MAAGEVITTFITMGWPILNAGKSKAGSSPVDFSLAPLASGLISTCCTGVKGLDHPGLCGVNHICRGSERRGQVFRRTLWQLALMAVPANTTAERIL